MKLNTGRFQKGHKPWNTGTKGVKPATSGSFKPGQNANENHPLWKGEDAGYVSKHHWVKRHYGKANKCEHCEKLDCKRYEWANISGEYKRTISDWVMLCTKCHHKMDNIQTRAWETRRGAVV